MRNSKKSLRTLPELAQRHLNSVSYNTMKPKSYMEIEEKRFNSYLGKVPSVDFCDDAYHYFLHYASVEELEGDILKLQTLIKIGEVLSNDLTQWGWNSCVWEDT